MRPHFKLQAPVATVFNVPDDRQGMEYNAWAGLPQAPDPFGMGNYNQDLPDAPMWGTEYSKSLPDTPNPLTGNYAADLPDAPDPFVGYTARLPDAPNFQISNTAPPEAAEPYQSQYIPQAPEAPAYHVQPIDFQPHVQAEEGHAPEIQIRMPEGILRHEVHWL